VPGHRSRLSRRLPEHQRRSNHSTQPGTRQHGRCGETCPRTHANVRVLVGLRRQS
jgi:hypothetical protein